ncbi:MAG: hypothetical protein K5757_13710 [Bacteroidaceae bacterium]|nr:hypothetical protein [Bacteroidaceae bacterium]
MAENFHINVYVTLIKALYAKMITSNLFKQSKEVTPITTPPTATSVINIQTL